MSLFETKQEILAAPAGDLATRWCRWLLADPRSRPLSPSSTVTIADYVQQRLAENTIDSVDEALDLAPDHALATARLAWLLLEHERATNRADFLSQRAVQLAPTNAAVQQIRADVLKRLGR